jgi:APA family basic amino acid/polyamine antiporter
MYILPIKIIYLIIGSGMSIKEIQKSKNKLGLWTTTSLVVGNMVGAGFFLLPAALASFGGIGLLGWLVSGTGALLLAHVFSRLSRLLPRVDGGPYAYTRKGFGDFAGFLVAWGYWISCWSSNAAITVSLVGSLSSFFPILARNALVAVLTGLGAIWILTWVNTLRIRASGSLQLITTILKLIPLVAITITGFFFIHWQHFIPFNRSKTSSFSAIIACAALTLYAFLGVECATIPAGNIKNPEKTIPRATMLGTAFTTGVYLFGTLSVMGILSAHELDHSVTPLADAAVALWGVHARYWMAGGVVIASLGALNGWILIQGQIAYAIAKDRLFPSLFERLNKNGVPALGTIISSVLVSVLMVMNFTKGLVEQFKFMLLLSTLTTLVPYIFVTAAYVIITMNKERLTPKGWVQTLLPASLAFIFSLLAVIGSGESTVFWGFVLLLAGIPVYVWVLWKGRSKNSPGI